MKSAPQANGVVGRFYGLAKPGIVYGNLIAAAAGYLFGAGRQVNVATFLGLLAGTAAVIAGGCVINNMTDVRLDARMERTKNRVLVKKTVSMRSAGVYALLLCAVGFGVLLRFTPLLTVGCGAVGLFFYVAVYAYFKRHSVLSTVVGTVAGAAPLVAGYVAATHELNATVLLLFLLMATWQVAHFYAIAIRRLHDYENAGLPLLPVKKGVATTKVQTVIFIILFGLTALSLVATGALSISSSVLLLGCCVWWIYSSLRRLTSHTSDMWAKRIFLESLVVLLVFNAALAVSSHLP